MNYNEYGHVFFEEKLTILNYRMPNYWDTGIDYQIWHTKLKMEGKIVLLKVFEKKNTYIYCIDIVILIFVSDLVNILD